MRAAILAVLLCAAVAGCRARAPSPLPNAFAHNDYAHDRPLFDALDHGFAGVEADVFLVDGRLLVGHEEKELRPGRTLESLYLEPLKAHLAKNGGRVYRGSPGFWLMIDVKSDAEPTYAVLRVVLERYRDMLTTWRGDQVVPGPVTVVLSGNRARGTIAAESRRLLAIDGRLEDLDGAHGGGVGAADGSTPVGPHPGPLPKGEGTRAASLVPWISAPWPKTFQWTGEGLMSAAEKEKLRGLIRRAHGQRRLIRFWGTPEKVEVWRELLNAGVDLINTDDLPGLARFLTDQGGPPSSPTPGAIP